MGCSQFLFASCFSFFFTQLDPGDPLRTFSFVLRVNDDEKYDVYNCEPNIDSNELAEILEELNGSEREDMSMLARRMRKFSVTRFGGMMTSFKPQILELTIFTLTAYDTQFYYRQGIQEVCSRTGIINYEMIDVSSLVLQAKL